MIDVARLQLRTKGGLKYRLWGNRQDFRTYGAESTGQKRVEEKQSQERHEIHGPAVDGTIQCQSQKEIAAYFTGL